MADRTHRPLLYLQAEDLGVNALMLGMNVKRIFQMATEWNAVILLDEADVFMAERHPHDIARNELVSIFLRELEYYRGIIFLTTNLYQTIDSAFRSRVSLHLLFKPLGLEAREAVWRKFLDRLPKLSAVGAVSGRDEGQDAVSDRDETGVVVAATKAEPNGVVSSIASSSAGAGSSNAEKKQESGMAAIQGDNDDDNAVPVESRHPIISITDEDLKELAAWQLNGREIKNAVKMVKSWCDCKGYDMTLSRLENGIRATSPHSSKVTHENDTSLYDD